MKSPPASTQQLLQPWTALLTLILVLLPIHGAWAEEKIVSGEETTDWPAVGALLGLPERQTTCTATLIGCDIALTAAHCLCQVEECTAAGPLVPASSLLVAFQGAPAVGVTRYDVHPTFSDRTQVDDVAVLHLSVPVTGIAPATLNTFRTPAIGSRGTTLGYGITSEQAEDSAGLKRQGEYSSIDCQQDDLPNATNLCWFFAAGDSGICSGDSGGPDFVDFGSGPVLAGIHTAASSCAPGAIGLSQDVFSYRDFIIDKAGSSLGQACSELPLLGDEGTRSESFTANLTSGQAVHTFTVPANTEVLRLGLNATEPFNSDLNLSLRQGSEPTATEFDCRSSFPGSFELCEITAPDPGPWLAKITRDSGGGVRYQLTASIFLGEDTSPPPAAPTNLQATTRSTSQIFLTWKDNADDETRLEVERRTAGGSFQVIMNLSADTEQALDTGLSPETSYAYRLRAVNDAGVSGYSNIAQATTPPVTVEPCQASDTVLCLNRGRFLVEVDWTDFAGNTGVGHVVPVSSDDSGLFYFFEPSNWEMLVKVLDGCAINDRYWVFAAVTTNVGFTLTVTDTATGARKQYSNPLGRAAPAQTDTEAFATCP